MSQICASIFRMYDIRGLVDDTLTEQGVRLIGRALGSEVLAQGQQTIVMGRDARLSACRFRDCLLQGLLSTGLNVIDIGQVPTPLVYFAACTLAEVNSGVVITGSHNAPSYNGIKMVVDGRTLFGEAIQSLYQRILQDDFLTGAGQLSYQNVAPAYVQTIASDIQLSRPLKVVVDAGNGVAGEVGLAVLSAIGCQPVPLYCEADGHFPNHHPDPAKPENLADLTAEVLRVEADLGIAFDGDGDRCGVVDNLGQSLYADRQLMLYAQEVLSRQPGAEVLYDIKCSALLHKWIEQAGGKATMWKTGHSFMKAKMRETGASLGGEVSGHIFWQDRWFGFDDGIYTAARMLEILANYAGTAAQLFATLPNGFNTPELEIRFAEGDNYAFMDAFKKQAVFEQGRVFDLDGVRVDFEDGWGLIRASNTAPLVTLRFEGESPAALARIQTLFKQKIMQVNAHLALPF